MFVDTLAKFLPVDESCQSAQKTIKPTSKPDSFLIPENLTLQPASDGDPNIETKINLTPFDLSAMKHTIDVLGKYYQHLASGRTMFTDGFNAGQWEDLKTIDNMHHKSSFSPTLVSHKFTQDDQRFSELMEKQVHVLSELYKKTNYCFQHSQWHEMTEILNQYVKIGEQYSYHVLSAAAMQAELLLQSKDYHGLAASIVELNAHVERILVSNGNVTFKKVGNNSAASIADNPIICQLDIDDLDLQKTVEGFLDGMPAVQELINRLHDKKAWEDLKAQIHQVKGTGGAFGFPQLTDVAKNIYKALDGNQYEKIPPLIEDLNVIYNRIYAGRKVA